ncbi:ABC transporter permease [Bacillus sp. SG-1]|uniref:ABC transporter permease n=1 Tax=Bacillus sp. SG-1 TaxID=161544 RepID=UPI0001544931|nr:ABC transporter permease [Bacillus sp. SG-1]EDL62918.1 YclI [Bacillus sp. SG-1]
MNFIKRAFLSVSARKGKSLLQLIVFTVICVLVLSGITIQTAAVKSGELARQQLGAEVTLQTDMEKLREQMQAEGSRQRIEQSPISVGAAQELKDYPQIKAYNFYSSTNAIAESFQVIESEDSSGDSSQTQEGRMPAMDGNRMFEADVSIQGVVFTDSVQEFMDETATLVDGRHLTEEDANSNFSVIEKMLADENELKVGDTLTVASVNEEAITSELEIVGIYETSAVEDSGQGMNFAFMSPYNKIYVPFTAASSLKGTEYENTIDRAVYHLKDPAEVDSFVSEAKQNSSIDFEVFTLDANDQLYQQMVGPIENVASFSKNVVYLVAASGAIILGLLVMMSIRERKYEMGVLMAIGEKRWKLIGQFIVEITAIAILALGLSTFSGNLVAGKIGEQLLTQEIQQAEEANVPDSFRNGGLRGGFGGGMAGQMNQQAEPVDELSIEVTPEDFGMLAGIGLFIAFLSALIPSLSILRLQPKTILTKQD